MYRLFLMTFVLAFFSLHATELENKIKALELQSAAQKDAKTLAALAQAYYQNQAQEKAFRTFLEALALPQQMESAISKEEELIYTEALKLYHDPSKTPGEIAKEIQTQYLEASNSHPEWYRLGYLVAVSDANGGNFIAFFERFFNSFSHVPNHFLAKKAQAVLHIKLLERAPTPAEQAKERAAIVSFTEQALNLEPNDHSLYRYLLSFTDKEKRAPCVTRCLNKIISNNIITPRTDILFYVQQAKECGDKELAKRYLEKAKDWYQYSRSIQVAENYLQSAQP